MRMFGLAFRFRRLFQARFFSNLPTSLTEEPHISNEDDRRPEEPTEGECCGSGCERCVWSVYFENLVEWQDRQAAAEKEQKKD